MGPLRQFPALVIMLLFAALLMLVPALHAVRLENWRIARTFLEGAVFFSVLAAMLGLATMNRVPRVPARYHLLTLLLAYLLLPLVLAAPLVALVPGLGLGGGYFEMLSCLTTTGATLFDRPQLLAEPLHLWRALVGWFGGLVFDAAGWTAMAGTVIATTRTFAFSTRVPPRLSADTSWCALSVSPSARYNPTS